MSRWAFLWIPFACIACSAPLRDELFVRLDGGRIPAALRAYEALRLEEGPDDELLLEIAFAVLEGEIRRGDPSTRAAAFSQLALAGTAAEPALTRLTFGREPAASRAMALLLKWDDEHRETLRSRSDHPEPEVRAAAVAALDPHEDLPLLVALSEDLAEAVRFAAVAALSEAAPDGVAQQALEQAARRDPSPAVRAAACNALVPFGPAAADAIYERLSDSDPQVRLRAASAFARAAPGSARELGALLSAPPHAAAVEAARVLAQPSTPGVPARERETARAYLSALLMGTDTELRNQAAVGVSSAVAGFELGYLRYLLANSPHPQVRLALARPLLAHPQLSAAAKGALVQLQKLDGMVGLQAAAGLAKLGDASAERRLRRALVAPKALFRAVAARSLAREAGRIDDLRHALHDPEVSVRLAAAGGIVARSAVR